MRCRLFCVLLFVAVLALAGCTPKQFTPPMVDGNNPAYHYSRGMEMADKGQADQADVHFRRALRLAPAYSPALAGMALVTAMTVKSQVDDRRRGQVRQQALGLLEKAENAVDGDSQSFCIHVTGIRVYALAKPEMWLTLARDAHGHAISLKGVDVTALPYYRCLEAADYFMGRAAYTACRFKDAKDLSSRVTNAPPGRWHQPASILYAQAHELARIMADGDLTDAVSRIAFKDTVTRVDVAAMLVNAFGLERLMADPVPVPDNRPENNFVPADISGHPFRKAVMTVLDLNLRGLEPRYDEAAKAFLFYPQAPVRRKDLASILDDLLAKITGDETLATAYTGQHRSPYTDVSPASPWYNAVMNVAGRNLMEPGLSGAFRPDDVADGGELAVAVMRLYDTMRIR